MFVICPFFYYFCFLKINVLVIPTFLCYTPQILPRTSKHRKYQNSVNLAMNIKTSQILQQFVAQNLKRGHNLQTGKKIKMPKIIKVAFYFFSCPTVQNYKLYDDGITTCAAKFVSVAPKQEKLTFDRIITAKHSLYSGWLIALIVRYHRQEFTMCSKSGISYKYCVTQRLEYLAIQ